VTLIMFMQNNHLFFSWRRIWLALSLCCVLPVTAAAVDEPLLRSEAKPEQLRPALALSGPFSIGVRTVELVNRGQADLTLQQTEDRQLTLEFWYPARDAGAGQPATYQSMTKSQQPFLLKGQAYRQAAPVADKKFPLVVLSHGYPGNRLLMFYLAEHLASHGYVVAAIDHRHSTYGELDQQKAPCAGFLSTLYHRSRDQQFVLTALRDKAQSQLQWLGGNVDTDSAAVIGYSMGGYGALNTVGGCFNFSKDSIAAFTGSKDDTATAFLQRQLNSCAGGQAVTQPKVDPAWKAAIAIAPWGGQHQLFSPGALQKLTVPVLYLAGDQDEVSGYDAMRALFELSGSKHKYFLTYHHAGHNIAPHPAPAVSLANAADYAHYAEPTWSTESLNDINRHFVLKMLDCHVKSVKQHCDLLAEQQSATPWPGYRKGLPTALSWLTSDQR
jgi:predicted dienelactone hydrolase